MDYRFRDIEKKWQQKWKADKAYQVSNQSSKPKFYVLGTKGAIVAEWDSAAEPKVADLPAILSLRYPDGRQEPIELLPVPPYAFHASIVEYINNTEVMSVTSQQSRDVVAVMEAAEESAKLNGFPVVPKLLRS